MKRCFIFFLVFLMSSVSLSAQSFINVPSGALQYFGINICGTDTGTATAYACNLPNLPSGFTFVPQDGVTYCFKPANTNTGTTPTLALNGSTAHTIKKLQGTTAVAISDISTASTGWSCVVYNAGQTTYDLLNPATSAGAGTVTSVAPGCAIQTVQGGTLQNISGSGTVQSAFLPNVQSGTSYNPVTGDCGKRIIYTNAGAVTATMPDATSGVGTNFPNGWYTVLENQSGGLLTISRTTSSVFHIDTSTSTTFYIGPNQSVELLSNATDWYVVPSGQRRPLSINGSGYMLPFDAMVQQTAGSAFGAHDNTVWQFVARQTMVVNKIRIEDVVAPTSGFINVALFSDNAAASANGSCGTLLQQATPIAAAASTWLEFTLTTAQVLLDGVPYWFAVTFDTAAGQNGTIMEAGSGLGAFLSVNETNRPRQGKGTATTGTGASLSFGTAGSTACGALTSIASHGVPNVGFLQ